MDKEIIFNIVSILIVFIIVGIFMFFMFFRYYTEPIGYMGDVYNKGETEIKITYDNMEQICQDVCVRPSEINCGCNYCRCICKRML